MGNIGYSSLQFANKVDKIITPKLVIHIASAHKDVRRFAVNVFHSQFQAFWIVNFYGLLLTGIEMDSVAFVN